jgi:hypothetical protein
MDKTREEYLKELEEVYPLEEYLRELDHTEIVAWYQEEMGRVLGRPVDYCEANGVAYSLLPDETVKERFRDEVTLLLRVMNGRQPEEAEVQAMLDQIINPRISL